MNDSFASFPELSSITTEIDIDSLNSACSNLDSSISSLNFNSGSFKSKFSSLNSNGVGISCVDSIAASVEKISSLVTSISNFLKTNVNNQVSADDSLLSQAEESTKLFQQMPNDQDILGASNVSSGGNGYFGGGGSSSSSYNSSVNNKDKDLSVGNNKTTNSSELNDAFINELSVMLESVAKNNNITVASLFDDKKYADILNQIISKVASNHSISSSNINDIGIEVIKKRILSMNNSNNISDFSANLVGNYITNIADLNNMSANEVVSKFSDYFALIGSEIDSVAKGNKSLVDIYDGNSVSEYSNDSIGFVRGVIDVVANDLNVSSEQLLDNSMYCSMVNEKLSEIGYVLKSL